MALTRRLDEIRDAVQRTADVVAFTDKHPVSYINDLINRGLGALSRICRTTNPEFQPLGSTTITTDGSSTSYSLPSNFRSLLSVEYIADGCKTWLIPYELHERSVLTTPDVTSASRRAQFYKVIGSNLELLPLAPANHRAFIWYATTVTQLASDSQTMETMERLDDYVIWYAAREIAQERENWDRVDRLTQRMAELEGDIRILARSIDLSHPGRVTRVEFANRYDRYGRRLWR
jgi:hypothetical protein